MWYALHKAFFRLLLRRLLDLRFEGGHQEPAPPYLLIANHTSALDDPLVALAVRARVYYMGKEELAQNVFMRLWIRSLGNFFVRRHEPDRAALRLAEGVLRQGRTLSVFPEGTRSLDGRVGTFWSGTAYLALRTGVPVLPVGLCGAYSAMPRGASWVRRFQGGHRPPVVVRVGPVISVPRVDGRITRVMKEEWTARFRAAVIALLPPEQQPLPAAGETVLGGAGRGPAG